MYLIQIPGYILFKKLEADITAYRQKFSHDPKIIFLENHGVFVGADTTGEIKIIYSDIIAKIAEQVSPITDISPIPYNPLLHKVLPVIRMLLSGDNPGVIRYRNNSLIARFYTNQNEFHKISLPLDSRYYSLLQNKISLH